jgi:aryl-alcohol dehydrogenase-like predicted oxidoreductase
MQTIILGSTGRSTTQLGFGGSSIMGVLNRRQSLALLESAYEAGIRHFDTAPMYGYGEAESCLGEFLARHRGEVTVTTKFGIPAAKRSALLQAARRVARPLMQRFPALKKHLRHTTSPASHGDKQAAPVANPIFNAEDARASLEKSLVALRVDRIDLWLLHDVKAIDLAVDSRHDPLLRFLEDAVREGKVGMFGAGTDREAIPELVASHPEYCGVLQYEWSVLNPPAPRDSRFRIHHRALSRHFHALAEGLKTDPERCRRWSEEAGEDLSSSATLARLMLKAACVLNPASILLFSSKRPEHIRQNVAVLEDPALDAPARRLCEMVQREGLRGSRN